MLLTYTEIPGIYVDVQAKKVWCSDHVKVESEEVKEDAVILKIKNDSSYPARVNVLIDRDRKKKLGHLYFGDMEQVTLEAGEEKSFSFLL